MTRATVIFLSACTALALLIACRAVRVRDAAGPGTDAATPIAAAGADAGITAMGPQPRPPSVQAWLDGVGTACKAGIGKERLQYCQHQPPDASSGDLAKCLDTCSGLEPTEKELAIYNDALTSCLRRMEESLGRADPQCVFSATVRPEILFAPVERCYASCRARAVDLRLQWGDRLPQEILRPVDGGLGGAQGDSSSSP
jgi:hypothetical protein